MGNVASDQLFILIQSMSKSEKRYFKLQPHQEEGNHRVLFDAIEKQTQYNEQKLIEALEGTGIENTLSLSKNRLYHVLLKSLASFHAKSDPNAELYRLIQSIDILLKRDLADQAHKLLHSAYKLAEKNEIIHLLPELFRLEEKCIDLLAVMQNERQTLLFNLEIKREKHLQLLSQINAVGLHKAEMMNEHFHNGQARNSAALEKIEKIQYAIQNALTDSTEATIKKHQVQGLIYLEMGNRLAALEELNGILSLLPADSKERIYATTLANKAVLQAQLELINDAYETLEHLEKAGNFMLYASSFLTVCIQLNLTDRAWNAIQDWNENQLLQFELSHIRGAHLLFQSAVVAFSKGEFKLAEKFTYRIIQDFPQEEGLHLLSISQLFYLVIQIELKNERFIPYALRNVQRFLQTRQREFEPEKKLLQFVNELLKKRKSIGANNPWTWLAHELRLIKQTDPRFFQYFNFLDWAEGKSLQRL
ncbi:MAG: hypothetical protein RL092_93 [Bacteroidota bacterium]